MTVETDNPFAEENDHRTLQFSLRSLMVFTFAACVVMSFGRVLGAFLMLLIGMQILLFKIVEADCEINSGHVRRPFLATAAFSSIIGFPILAVLTVAVASALVNYLMGTPW